MGRNLMVAQVEKSLLLLTQPVVVFAGRRIESCGDTVAGAFEVRGLPAPADALSEWLGIMNQCACAEAFGPRALLQRSHLGLGPRRGPPPK